jgi:hypothetical protein
MDDFRHCFFSRHFSAPEIWQGSTWQALLPGRGVASLSKASSLIPRESCRLWSRCSTSHGWWICAPGFVWCFISVRQSFCTNPRIITLFYSVPGCLRFLLYNMHFYVEIICLLCSRQSSVALKEFWFIYFFFPQNPTLWRHLVDDW